MRDSGENEVYLAYIEGEQYAVFFPDGGSVTLDLTDYEGSLSVDWLTIDEISWAAHGPGY